MSLRGTAPPEASGPVAAALAGAAQSRLRGAGLVRPAAALALLPVAVAAVRAVVQGWMPLADNAIYVIRSLDVFSREHFPLVGTWSAGSQGSGLDYNHPGPLLFDLLAVPVRALGMEGAAVGVGVLNGAAVLVCVVFAHRRQDGLGALLAAAVATALCWSMGSEALIEPWNPHSMVLPFLALLFLTWSIASGDLVAMPLAAFVGSLVAQTHLSYVLPVLALAGWAAVGLVLEVRRRTAEDPAGRPPFRGRAVRAAALSAAVVAACWAQPLGQQLFGEGQGNLTKIVESSTAGDGSKLGLSDAVLVVADVLAVPPGWLPPSFESPWNTAYFPSGLPRFVVAVGSLLGLAGLLAGCGALARRAGDRVLGTAVVTSGVGLAVALVNASSAPLTVAGVPAHHFRWLWSLGAFVGFTLLATVGQVVLRTEVGRRWAVPAVAVSIGLMSLAAVPATDRGSQPRWAVPVMQRVAAGLDPLEGQGPVFMRSPRLDDYFSVAILAELRLRGIPFTVDASLARQVGEGRRLTADGAVRELGVLLGEGGPAAVPPGAEVVVRDRGPLSQGRRREADRVRTELVRELADGSIRTRLHPTIEPFLEAGNYPVLRSQRERGSWDPDELLASGELLPLALSGLVVTDERERDLVDRLVPLQEQLDTGTVTVVLTETDPPAPEGDDT